MGTFNNAYLDELGRSPEVVAVVNQHRDRIASVIRASAPVGLTGNYKRRIITTGKVQKRRYVGLIVATDEKSLIIESKLGIMARGVRAASRGRG